MNPLLMNPNTSCQQLYFKDNAKLDFSQIAKTDIKSILGPLEAKTGYQIEIISLASILEPQSNESDPQFQQLSGDFLLFLSSIFKEINAESVKYADEGYKRQGSRMTFHRQKSINKTFLQVLNDPQRNALFFVRNTNTEDILGSISVLQAENGLPEISDFYLSKELRRDSTSPKVGVGKYLFSQMLCFVSNLGYREVFLTSRRKGGFEQALNLYYQFGFKEVTKIDDINRLVRPEYQSKRTIAMLLSLEQ